MVPATRYQHSYVASYGCVVVCENGGVVLCRNGGDVLDWPLCVRCTALQTFISSTAGPTVDGKEKTDLASTFATESAFFKQVLLMCLLTHCAPALVVTC